MVVQEASVVGRLLGYSATCYRTTLVFFGALLSLEFYVFDVSTFDIFISKFYVFGVCICFW